MVTLVGVDGGGSHSEVAVSDATGDPLVRRSGDRGNVTRGDESDTATRLATVIRAALAEAARREPVDVLVIGAAGAGDPEVAAALRMELAGQFEARVIEIITDVDIAFKSVFPAGDGIVLSGGTGSIAVGRTTAGETARAGGYGWRFGDDGSGYAIGRAAVNAALRAFDGRAEATSLGDLLPPSTSVQAWLDGLTPRDAASMVTRVASAAAAGDDVARSILKGAASDLVDHVAAVAHRLAPSTRFSVAFNGGLLDPNLPVRGLVRDEIARRGLDLAVYDQDPDPVLGALRRAVELWTANTEPA